MPRSIAVTFIAMLMPLAAHADLYAARNAFEAKDYPRAFELYRELAELGHPEAQEQIAVMYVNGEGVKRDNLLGYAWAALALENGESEAAKTIVAQLEPHLTAAARARIAEVHAKFGKAVLEERLLHPKIPFSNIPGQCRARVVPDPDGYFPWEAKRQMVSGTVDVEATVAPDGHARIVRAWKALPPNVFEEAARRVAFDSVYETPKVNGVPVSCTVRMFVRFKIRGVDATDEPTAEQEKTVAEFKAKAEAGDPHSQLAYSFLLTMRPDMRSADLNMDLTLRAAQAGIPAAQYLVGMRALPRDIGQPAGKGVIWLQMAADAGQHDAQAALASYLLRTASPDDFGKAQDLLEKAAASDHAEGKFYLAALLAAGPDSARRDPGRALVLLEQVKDSFDFDPTWFEIRAAAKAMLGEFAGAEKDQKAALQKARKLEWDTKDLQARLVGYAASKPWTGNFFLY